MLHLFPYKAIWVCLILGIPYVTCYARCLRSQPDQGFNKSIYLKAMFRLGQWFHCRLVQPEQPQQQIWSTIYYFVFKNNIFLTYYTVLLKIVLYSSKQYVCQQQYYFYDLSQDNLYGFFKYRGYNFSLWQYRLRLHTKYNFIKMPD